MKSLQRHRERGKGQKCIAEERGEVFTGRGTIDYLYSLIHFNTDHGRQFNVVEGIGEEKTLAALMARGVVLRSFV